MSERTTLRARFDDYEAFVRALRELKSRRVPRYDAFGPTNLAELEDLMPRKGSNVRVWATTGAIIGLVTFFMMCVLSSLIFNLITGGKPPVSNVPFVVVSYEGTILVGAIAAFLAVLAYALLGPRGRTPADCDPRYTEDQFGIHIRCEKKDKDDIAAVLRQAGATEIDEMDQPDGSVQSSS